MLLSDGYNNCTFQTTEDLDQQLMRISTCYGGGTFAPAPEMESPNLLLYELPQTSLPVNAPLDATKISPGEVVTEQPAPSQVSVYTTAAAETTEPAPQTTPGNSVIDFVKKNPLLVGAVAVGALYILSKKRKK